jgi:hypothetical protein
MAFAFDVVLAAACMIVLVFTWISNDQLASLSMLAAYATIPLLVNLSESPIKKYIALRTN